MDPVRSPPARPFQNSKPGIVLSPPKTCIWLGQGESKTCKAHRIYIFIVPDWEWATIKLASNNDVTLGSDGFITSTSDGEVHSFWHFSF